MDDVASTGTLCGPGLRAIQVVEYAVNPAVEAAYEARKRWGLPHVARHATRERETDASARTRRHQAFRPGPRARQVIRRVLNPRVYG